MIAALGWLVFGVAGDRSRLHPLPDTAGSTVAWLADAGKTRSPSDVAAARPEAMEELVQRYLNTFAWE